MAIDRLPRLSPPLKRIVLAPYDIAGASNCNRSVCSRYSHEASHRTYAVLETLERNLVRLVDKPIHFLWGMKVGVLSRNVWSG